MLIDSSAAFDGLNQQGIINRLCSVRIVGSVLSILTQFLSNRSQHVMVNGCRSELVDVVSGETVFLANYCSSYALRSIFPFWKIS